MKIIENLKHLINKIKNSKGNKLLLYSHENLYTNLISNSQINSVINNMPSNLSEIEKAYYIYLELGKIISENPKYVFTDISGKEKYYNVSITDDYYGICKSISELYVSILNDKRIGISADLVKRYPKSPVTHVDTILKINGKKYIANLISDLSRIKTSRRVNSFCFDLGNPELNPIILGENLIYLENLESYYGTIDYLSKEDIEKLDKKLGYSFFIPNFSSLDERGIYTEDTIELLKKEMNNPELLKKYVLNNKDIPEDEILKYKLDYIFDHINQLTDFNSDNINYLENIRYYLYIARKILSSEECSRIKAYATVSGHNVSNIISILKIKPLNQSNTSNGNVYYIYSSKEQKYIYKTHEEMQEFLNGINKDTLNIIGTFDRYNPQNINELEI